ncbi:MAG TPA: hypothetical protein VHF01_03800 [Candidatus Acidoferrum sp.]|nr:hypothetical protein [Candidatus Acidoferrum sp.]
MVRNLLLKPESHEPTIRKMHPHFFEQTPFARDPIEIANEQQRTSTSGSIDGRPVKL